MKQKYLDALDDLAMKVGGMGLMVDGLLLSIEQESVPHNLEDARCYISSEMDSIAEEIKAMLKEIQRENLMNQDADPAEVAG